MKPEQTSIKLETIRCPRCGCPEFKTQFEGKDTLHNVGGTFYVSSCTKCGLWYQNPRPAAGEFDKLYPAQEYQPYQPAKTEALPKAYALWHIIPAEKRMLPRYACIGLRSTVVPGGKMLEIGCATGKKMEGNRKAGWETIIGVEPSAYAAEQARAKGFVVYNEPAEQALTRFRENEFDAVVMSMVFEHFLEPFKTMETVAKILKPGGQLMLSTVIRDCIDYTIFKEKAQFWDLPRHMTFPTRRDLISMLEKDYSSIEIRNQNSPYDYFRSSLLCERRIGKLLWQIARTKPGYYLCDLAALAGKTCRISIRCRKR